MKLTNQQIYRYSQELLDKANNPHETPFAFKQRYEAARLIWLRLNSKDFEVTETQRQDLRPFIRTESFGTTKEVPLNNLNLFRITGLSGDFTFECSGKRTVRTIEIKPRTIDTAIASLTDAFNMPDDTEPIYTENFKNGGNVLEILSTTTPANVTLWYIKEPEEYKLLTDPNGFTEEGYEQQLQIIDLAVKNFELQIENYNRYSGRAQEINSSGI